MSDTKGLTRKEKAERTKSMLFEKGCEILKNVDAFDDFVVEDITDACGVAKGTFYLHFKSKSAFFYNVKHVLAQEANKEFAGILQDTNESSRDNILEFVRQWVLMTKSLSMPLSEELLALIRDTDSSDAAPRGMSPKRFEQLFQRQIETGVARGEFVRDAPAERMSTRIVVVLAGFWVHLYAQGKSLDYNEWAEEAVTLVDNGVLRPWYAKRQHRRWR